MEKLNYLATSLHENTFNTMHTHVKLHSMLYIHLYSPKTVEKKNNTKAIKSKRKANNLTKQIDHSYNWATKVQTEPNFY